jgi:hypothetical protein
MIISSEADLASINSEKVSTKKMTHDSILASSRGYQGCFLETAHMRKVNIMVLYCHEMKTKI